MIEKLPFTEIHSGGEDMVDRVESRPVPSYKMQHKINELVDAVNELQTTISKMETVAENGNFAKNAQDPYAEQRRWIGKLCKFYKNGEMVSIDILRAVAEKGTFFPFRSTNDWYEHCEPVKPDDDIIFKGGDNE